jgi:hypothetical protein
MIDFFVTEEQVHFRNYAGFRTKVKRKLEALAYRRTRQSARKSYGSSSATAVDQEAGYNARNAVPLLERPGGSSNDVGLDERAQLSCAGKKLSFLRISPWSSHPSDIRARTNLGDALGAHRPLRLKILSVSGWRHGESGEIP